MRKKLLLIILPISIISLAVVGSFVDPFPISNEYGAILVGNIILQAIILTYELIN